jgi:hypothetical protein
MSKHSSKFRFSTPHNKLLNLLLPIAGLVCLIAFGTSAVGGLVAITGTGAISTAALTTLVINTLRILFIAYLLFGIVQIFKASGNGKDRNI